MPATRPKPWNENEIKEAVKVYVKLLKLELDNIPFVKATAYRNLAHKIPDRSVKSIEFKFQNISAILHENGLPYLTGLKPKFNYQSLLRLVVLDEFQSKSAKPLQPWEILTNQLRYISKKGEIRVQGKGTGRFGLTIESELGISQNSSKNPDFMGIEIKTKFGKSLQTLFSKTPDSYLDCGTKANFFAKHAYDDTKRSRRALYTSFYSKPDSLGFTLKVKGQSVMVLRDRKELLEFNGKSLEEALLKKHAQTFYIEVIKKSTKGNEFFTLGKVKYCKWPSVLNFFDLVNDGHINLDFTLSEKQGRIKDHGFLWRVNPEFLDQLYLKTSEIRLD